MGSPRASLDKEAERRGTSSTEFPQAGVLQPDGLRKLDLGEGTSDGGLESQPDNEGYAIISSQRRNSQDISARPSMDSRGSISQPSSFDMDRSITDMDCNGSAMGDMDTAPKTRQQYEDTIGQMRSDYKTSEVRRQEETHLYLERIDALQSKLRYLAKEAADTARKAASEAVLGSMDQKVAAKEEKIALLLEEGEKLSQTELRHLNTIKKLRAKAVDDEKKLADATKKLERFERLARESKENVRRAEAAEMRATERLRNLPAMVQEIEYLRLELDHNTSTIEQLQNRLSETTSMVEAANQRVQANSLEAERTLASVLQDRASNAKMELELNDERHRAEVRNLEEIVARERERARVAETEMRAEHAVSGISSSCVIATLNFVEVLESRMEALRARAEEVYTGSTGDAQSKLLRQVETLQNQYAFASENWQGIEASLLARVAGLERERDGITRRESEARRKARETVCCDAWGKVALISILMGYRISSQDTSRKNLRRCLKSYTGRSKNSLSKMPEIVLLVRSWQEWRQRSQMPGQSCAPSETRGIPVLHSF